MVEKLLIEQQPKLSIIFLDKIQIISFYSNYFNSFQCF